MSKATDIIDALGRSEIKARLNVGMTTISAAYVDGVLPSSWFGVIEEMAAEKGIDCPRDAFRFKSTSEPKILSEIPHTHAKKLEAVPPASSQ